MNDSNLCLRAQSGDSAAAAELLKTSYQKVFGYFRRLCGSEHDAEDLTQKTFSKVWGALPQFKGSSSVSTWIHGIAHHVYVDWRRKGNRLEPQSDDWWAACASDEPGPFENIAEKESAQRLYTLVDSLEPETREAVHLHYYRGLTLSETAAVLSVSASTVKNRLREALDFLRAGMVERRLRQ
jgi:RNA polymerase sigma-70 factor (ECF subfamily)